MIDVIFSTLSNTQVDGRVWVRLNQISFVCLLSKPSFCFAVFCNSRTETKTLAGILSKQCVISGTNRFIRDGDHAESLHARAMDVEGRVSSTQQSRMFDPVTLLRACVDFVLLGDSSLQHCLRLGIGFHSAGMSFKNRSIVRHMPW